MYLPESSHISHTEDTRKVSTLQLLAGYLWLLGPDVISLTYSLPHLTRITQALIQVSIPPRPRQEHVRCRTVQIVLPYRTITWDCGPYIPLWTSHIWTIMEITYCRDGHYLLTLCFLILRTGFLRPGNEIHLAWDLTWNEIHLAWE